jgi:hypothetical protein
MRFTSFSEYREITIYIVLFRLSRARPHVFGIPHFVHAAANGFICDQDSRPRSLLARLTECRRGELDLEGSLRLKSGNLGIGLLPKDKD